MRIESAVQRPGMRARRAKRALAGRNRIRHLDPKAAACVVGPALQVAGVGSRGCNALQEPVASVSRSERHAWSGARKGRLIYNRSTRAAAAGRSSGLPIGAAKAVGRHRRRISHIRGAAPPLMRVSKR